MKTGRIHRLAQAARVKGMDALALMPGANLHYLTGLSLHLSERVALALVPTDGRDLALVLPALEQPRAQAPKLDALLTFAESTPRWWQ